MPHLARCCRSVFRGGTLELIEAVYVASADIGMPAPDGLRELVDHSLLRQRQAFKPLDRVRHALDRASGYRTDKLRVISLVLIGVQPGELTNCRGECGPFP